MKVFLILLGFFVLTGCTSLHTYSNFNETAQKQSVNGNILRKGDEIKVVTLDGSEHFFEIQELSDTQIIGESKSINILDVKYIEVKRENVLKTLGLVGGVLGVVILANALRNNNSRIFDIR